MTAAAQAQARRAYLGSLPGRRRQWHARGVRTMPANLAGFWDDLTSIARSTEAMFIPGVSPVALPPAPAAAASAPPAVASSSIDWLAQAQSLSNFLYNVAWGQLTDAQKANIQGQINAQIARATGCGSDSPANVTCNRSLMQIEQTQAAGDIANVFAQSEAPQTPNPSSLPNWIWLVGAGALLWLVAQ